ncbi:F-box protein At5g52880 isoform X1 [Arachis hypogaea]|uniref:F-box domain-containing protein n=1 Tax=Arachis hypogaea TaxID=3818 RepID=A0A445BG59_ARAHY|nr:F-box protein At5g52880 isoform X1 [Arachis hypogaea]RYR37672.1 hypothetical protein Ahy_A09g042541 [Arachis hypogaea]
MNMRSQIERYEKLGLRESLPKIYRYPIACREIGFILREAYIQFPKNLQSIIFHDTLAAFRLLPQIQTQSAVSAVHFLLQSVEAALPKQKRNMAVKEFKLAMVAHKRRSKPQHQEEKDSFQLPHDVLVHIFSFLDMQSLVSVGLVCGSWNLAANDNHLWELQYVVLYGNAAKQQLINRVEDRNKRHLQELTDTKSITDWKEAVNRAYTVYSDAGALAKKLTTNRGYCVNCRTVVWLNNSKCPNVHSGMISEVQEIKPVTPFQVVEYVLDDSLSLTSSSDSDSDSEGGPVSRLWALPKM